VKHKTRNSIHPPPTTGLNKSFVLCVNIITTLRAGHLDQLTKSTASQVVLQYGNVFRPEPSRFW